jgi:NAD(P)-dependent dehydrogenase (short-subunit alcohol dehydrogenase family)
MAREFEGKVVVITGGTSGIGRATALQFADAGAHVVITGRREKEGNAVAAEIAKRGVKSRFVQGDISRDEDSRKAVDAAIALGGRLDIAFNNAGVEGDRFVPLVETTEKNYDFVFDINVKGVLLSMKHQVRAMLNNPGGPGGSIINNSSVAGSIGLAGMAVYVASKHAVIGLTKATALEVAKQGIRINTVSPGAIETEMFDRFAGGSGTDVHKMMESMHPVGRVGTSDEIASAVLWLSTPGASFVTGHDLRVDGGFTAQ